VPCLVSVGVCGAQSALKVLDCGDVAHGDVCGGVEVLVRGESCGSLSYCRMWVVLVCFVPGYRATTA